MRISKNSHNLQKYVFVNKHEYNNEFPTLLTHSLFFGIIRKNSVKINRVEC